MFLTSFAKLTSYGIYLSTMSTKKQSPIIALVLALFFMDGTLSCDDIVIDKPYTS